MVKLSGKYLDLWMSYFNEYKGISFIDNKNQERSCENSDNSKGQHETGAKGMFEKSKISKSEKRIRKKKKKKGKPNGESPPEVEPEDTTVELDSGDGNGTREESSVIEEETPALKRRRKKLIVSSSSKKKLFTHNFQREVKRFSKEEDEKILRAIETAKGKGNHLMISELCKEINRPYHSTRDRVWKLKYESPIRRNFTLTEDLVIIDEVLKYIGQETLREIPLPNPGKLSKQLTRSETSCKARWQYYLKPMLLQYYTRTLNLDVRFILVDYLAQVYPSLEEVRWEEVVTARPEFSGHTDSSLRYQFLDLHKALRRRKLIDNSGCSLADVARASKEYFQLRKERMKTEAKLQRQSDVTTYFDNFVKKHKLQPGI